MSSKSWKHQPIPAALEDKLLWSVPETCERLGLGRTIVLALAYDGTLPSIKVGRRRMFPANKVREWAASLPGAAPLSWEELKERDDLELRQMWSKTRWSWTLHAKKQQSATSSAAGLRFQYDRMVRSRGCRGWNTKNV